MSATFLGFEALDTDTFAFTLDSGTLNNKGAMRDDHRSGRRPPAQFHVFRPVRGHVGWQRTEPGRFHLYPVLGSFAGSVFTPFTLGGAYDLILGFNDGLRVDADDDDMVVGLKVKAVPEPETYAMMLAGLGALGFMGRRRLSERRG